MRTGRLAAVVVALGASGCAFQIPEGLACDDTHACAAGFRCTSNRCTRGSDPDAGTDGDAGGSGWPTFTPHLYATSEGPVYVNDGESLDVDGISGDDLAITLPMTSDASKIRLLHAPYGPSGGWASQTDVPGEPTGRPVLGAVGPSGQPGLSVPTSVGFSTIWRTASGTVGGPSDQSVGRVDVIATGRLDRDMIGDWVLVRAGSDTVERMLQLAPTPYELEVAIDLMAPPSRLALVDFDDDGDHDLVGGPTNEGVSKWTNDGTGTFTATGAAPFPAGETFRALRAGPALDGSRSSDVVVCGLLSAGMGTRVRSITGGPGRLVDVTVPGGCVDVAIGHLRGGSNPDVAVLGANGVLLLASDGMGGLGEGVSVPIDGSPTSLAILDLDGDGDADMAVGTSTGLVLLVQD